MSVKQATPYLFLDGEAAEAIEFYKSSLGAKVEGLMTYEQMPAEAGYCAPEDKNRVMHALLHIDRARVMISDRTSKQASPGGSNVHVVLDCNDVTDMTKKFNALSQAGDVKMAIHDAFWGDKFGAVQDRFGVHWMFTCTNSPTND